MHSTSHRRIRRQPKEPASTDLRELARVREWRIRRCDAFNLLFLDALNENDQVSRDHVIVFTPREYRMLVPLLEQMGQPLPFAALIDGSFDIRRDRNLLRPHMAHLRKKIAHLGIVIRPIKGYGYLAQIDDQAIEKAIST